MFRRHFLALRWILGAFQPAQARDFAGPWTMVTPNGGPLTLTIQVDAGGRATGNHGSGAGQSAGGQHYYWQVQGNTRQVSADRAHWVPVNLQVSRSSNGHRIVTARWDGIHAVQLRR